MCVKSLTRPWSTKHYAGQCCAHTHQHLELSWPGNRVLPVDFCCLVRPLHLHQVVQRLDGLLLQVCNTYVSPPFAYSKIHMYMSICRMYASVFAAYDVVAWSARFAAAVMGHLVGGISTAAGFSVLLPFLQKVMALY